jgi:uncharacterized membrane protein YbhN (UPF0104 family)
MQRSVLKLAIRLIGPALLVVVLYRLQDAHLVLARLDRRDILPISAAMLLNALNYYFKVLRWDVLLHARGHRYSRLRAWTSFLSSGYLGLLTPGRVGDLLRIQYLRHDLQLPYADGLALLTVDRLCDLYVLLAFTAIGIACFGAALTGHLALVLWLVVAITALAPCSCSSLASCAAPPLSSTASSPATPTSPASTASSPASATSARTPPPAAPASGPSSPSPSTTARATCWPARSAST